jgi:hypothetical protein
MAVATIGGAAAVWSLIAHFFLAVLIPSWRVFELDFYGWVKKRKLSG